MNLCLFLFFVFVISISWAFYFVFSLLWIYHFAIASAAVMQLLLLLSLDEPKCDNGFSLYGQISNIWCYSANRWLFAWENECALYSVHTSKRSKKTLCSFMRTHLRCQEINMFFLEYRQILNEEKKTINLPIFMKLQERTDIFFISRNSSRVSLQISVYGFQLNNWKVMSNWN